MKTLERLLKAAAVLSATAVISACGTSGTSGGSTSVSGKVADGYLVGATVCLDKNGNKKCDTDEPTATTTAGGSYELKNITSADLAFPVVVEVPVGAIDEDKPGVPIVNPYVLSAPAGKTDFVSPLTTLVQNQIETAGLSAVEAEATVKQQLGLTTMSPLDDYKPGSSIASAEAKQAANVARVIATTIADNSLAIQTAVQTSGGTTTTQAVVNLIVQQVMQNLATVVQQVKANQDSSGVLTDDKMATISGAVSVATDDKASLQQQLSVANTATVASDLVTAVTNGMYSIEQGQNGWDFVNNKPIYAYWYQKVMFAPATQVVSFSEYDLMDNSWSTKSSSENGVFLTSTGWQAESNSTGTYDAASGVFTSASGLEKMQVRTVKIDVSNQLIAPFLKGNFMMQPTVTDTFPAGSEAYKMTMIPVVDEYRLSQGWVICKTWNNTNNSCGTGYASLTDLLASASVGSTNNWIGGNNYSAQFGPLGSDNKGEFRISVNSPNTAAGTAFRNGMTTITSAYELKTVNNVQMIIADASPVNEGFLLMAMYDGNIHGGDFRPANVAKIEKGYNFNQAAMKAIMSAVGLPTTVAKAVLR